jgi:hypothetical protein
MKKNRHADVIKKFNPVKLDELKKTNAIEKLELLSNLSKSYYILWDSDDPWTPPCMSLSCCKDSYKLYWITHYVPFANLVRYFRQYDDSFGRKLANYLQYFFVLVHAFIILLFVKLFLEVKDSVLVNDLGGPEFKIQTYTFYVIQISLCVILILVQIWGFSDTK